MCLILVWVCFSFWWVWVSWVWVDMEVGLVEVISVVRVLLKVVLVVWWKLVRWVCLVGLGGWVLLSIGMVGLCLVEVFFVIFMLR